MLDSPLGVYMNMFHISCLHILKLQYFRQMIYKNIVLS